MHQITQNNRSSKSGGILISPRPQHRGHRGNILCKKCSYFITENFLRNPMEKEIRDEDLKSVIQVDSDTSNIKLGNGLYKSTKILVDWIFKRIYCQRCNNVLGRHFMYKSDKGVDNVSTPLNLLFITQIVHTNKILTPIRENVKEENNSLIQHSREKLIFAMGQKENKAETTNSLIPNPMGKVHTLSNENIIKEMLNNSKNLSDTFRKIDQIENDLHLQIDNTRKFNQNMEDDLEAIEEDISSVNEGVREARGRLGRRLNGMTNTLTTRLLPQQEGNQLYLKFKPTLTSLGIINQIPHEFTHPPPPLILYTPKAQGNQQFITPRSVVRSSFSLRNIIRDSESDGDPQTEDQPIQTTSQKRFYSETIMSRDQRKSPTKRYKI